MIKSTWSRRQEGLKWDKAPVSNYMEKPKIQLDAVAEKAKITYEIEEKSWGIIII